MKKLQKIAFYCIGNFSEFNYHATLHYDFCQSIFYIQNFKGLEFFSSLKNSNILYRYQYENFNKLFEKCAIDERLNYNIICNADKMHYKKHNQKYIQEIISTFAFIYRKWLEKDSPDFIFFPIIESLDAMCLYEVAKSMGIRTIVYSHFRILPYSFLSENKYEELPLIESADKEKILNKIATDEIAKIVKQLSENSKPVVDQMTQTIKNINGNNTEPPIFTPKYKNPFARLLKNIKYKMVEEKHNKILNNYIKFQVFIERVLVPLQREIFKITEKVYLNKYKKPLDINSYNFFAMHFSPESSINTPAPYYIDQLRVVDRILLQSKKPLIVREHPAMYGKRGILFYVSLFKRQRVFYSPSDESVYSGINGAETVYTVTGTVALEAFFKDKNYKQFGRNFFSSFEKIAAQYEMDNKTQSKKLMVSIVLHIGKQFIVLPHSNRNKEINDALFSKINIENFGKALKFHISKPTLNE